MPNYIAAVWYDELLLVDVYDMAMRIAFMLLAEPPLALDGEPVDVSDFSNGT